jgi:hypothetical protein
MLVFVAVNFWTELLCPFSVLYSRSPIFKDNRLSKEIIDLKESFNIKMPTWQHWCCWIGFRTNFLQNVTIFCTNLLYILIRNKHFLAARSSWGFENPRTIKKYCTLSRIYKQYNVKRVSRICLKKVCGWEEARLKRQSFQTRICFSKAQILFWKLSMTFEPGLLPSTHFLEANMTHSFYSVQSCSAYKMPS